LKKKYDNVKTLYKKTLRPPHDDKDETEEKEIRQLLGNAVVKADKAAKMDIVEQLKKTITSGKLHWIENIILKIEEESAQTYEDSRKYVKMDLFDLPPDRIDRNMNNLQNNNHKHEV